MDYENKAIELSEQSIEDGEIMIKNKLKCEYVLTDHIDVLRENRKNIGYDMSFIELLRKGYLAEEERQELYKWYGRWKDLENKIKRADKLVDTLLSKVSYEQSKMKYNMKGGG